MHPDRVLHLVPFVAAIGLAACFDPTYRDPFCGGERECPSGWTCANGPGKACSLESTVPDASPDASPDAREPAPGEPDAMPCEPEWISVLANGGFEEGSASSWTKVPSNVEAIYRAGDGLPVTPQSGSWAALLGGHDLRTQTLSQVVTLPKGASRIRLKGYRCLATAEVDPVVYDVMTLTLVKATDDTAELASFASWSNLDAASTCNWVFFDVDRPVALPEQAALRIFSKLDNGRVTTLYLDTLSLEAFACRP